MQYISYCVTIDKVINITLSIVIANFYLTLNDNFIVNGVVYPPYRMVREGPR